MRVLFWSLGFLPEMGGIEVLAGKFLPAMQERGYEYVVVTSRSDPSLPSETSYKGISIHRFPFWHSLVNIDELADVKRQIAWLKRVFAPDLIHINGLGRDNFFHLTTANAHRAPVLVTLHGEWALQAEPMVRRMLTSATWVAGCSKAILDKAQQLVPAIIPRSSVIYNGVEEPSLPMEPQPIAQRALCLGRMSEEKGFDLALTAFAAIIKRFPRARLVFAGDGPAHRQLEQQSALHGLTEFVEFLGWVSPENIPALINASTVVLMPSRFEAFGLVSLEAALMGRPVVASRAGGLPEIVLDHETGLLVEKEDSQALARAMAFFFEHPEAVTRMGQAARRRAETDFAWKRHVDCYDALYRDLVADRREGTSTARTDALCE